MSAMTTAAEPRHLFKARGGNQAIWHCTDREILVEGPTGTGKTRSILEFIHALCASTRDVRVLILRKTRVSLSTSVLRTFDEEVNPFLDGVEYFSGNGHRPEGYYYKSSSFIGISGMDNPAEVYKVLSSAWDIIYINQVEEITLEEWETLLGRLRHYAIEEQQLIGDCNPTYAKHWLNQRCLSGLTTRIITTHRDNPAYYDDNGDLTELGRDYILGTLESYTGSRRERLLYGRWVGVENAIYPHFDRQLHIRPLPPNIRWRTGAIGVDYGRRHKAASVVIAVDTQGRRWVLEAWGEPDTEQGQMTRRTVARQKARYSIYRGRADPTQDALAGTLGFNTARTGAGARNARTIPVGRLLNVFPGGIVPESWQEWTETGFRSAAPLGPSPESADSPGLLFVQYPQDDPRWQGLQDLFDEIESYHEVVVDTERAHEYTVARIDDDLIAALEYAIEELEQPPIDHEAMGALLRGRGRKRKK